MFLFIFAFSKFSRRATKLHEKGHFARVLEKWGAYPLCPPIPTSMNVPVLENLGKGFLTYREQCTVFTTRLIGSALFNMLETN